LRWRSKNGVVTSRYGKTRVAVFPIGIDVEKIRRAGKPGPASHPDVSRLRRSLNGEKLGDRRRSAGLFQGAWSIASNAFDRMWILRPALERTVSLLQIATPVAGRDRSLWQFAETNLRGWSAMSMAVTARWTGPRSAISTGGF